jgi:hypothetical protein
MYEEKATKITRKNRAKLKKPSQTRIGRFEPVFVLKTEPKPVGLNRFQFF